jgi:hypothetical protein
MNRDRCEELCANTHSLWVLFVVVVVVIVSHEAVVPAECSKNAQICCIRTVAFSAATALSPLAPPLQ